MVVHVVLLNEVKGLSLAFFAVGKLVICLPLLPCLPFSSWEMIRSFWGVFRLFVFFHGKPESWDIKILFLCCAYFLTQGISPIFWL